jgi:hypothetical protein
MGGQARAGPAGHPLRVRRISTAKFLDGHPARQNMQSYLGLIRFHLP